MSYTPPAGDLVNFDLQPYIPPAGDLVDFELADVPPHQSLWSFLARNKIGKPDAPNPHGHYGIYQSRKKQGGPDTIRMKFYAPTNPRTEAQQANRNKFADAMTAWQSLTESEKEVYHKRAKPLKMFGHNLFIREYMLD